MKTKRQSTKQIKVTVGNVMVRIYIRNRPTASGKSSPYYYVADYTSGKRRMQGFSDAGKARHKAEQIARQVATGETTAATMRNSEAASYGRAVQLLEPTGLSLEMAAANYAKAFEILGGDYIIEAAKFYALHRADQITRRTVAQVVAELIEARENAGKSDRYLADLRARLTRFANDFAVDISTVTGPDVQGWLNRLKGAPQTKKNFRTVLFTLFSFAESLGYILKGSNPVADTESISTNGDGAIEIYSPAEIAAILKAAPIEFLPFVALGAFAGLRAAETERIEWSDIDLTGKYITVSGDNAKTRSRRLVPIQPNLSAWLERVPIEKRKGNVWKGTPDTLRDVRAETVKTAKVENAEIEWKDNALRHSFISYRLADVQDAAKVALEAGNSPAVVFRHYRELVKPDAAKTWFSIAPERPENVVTMPTAAAK
jgi:integrase